MSAVVFAGGPEGPAIPPAVPEVAPAPPVRTVNVRHAFPGGKEAMLDGVAGVDRPVRVVAISDTHSMHDQMAPLPPGDILVHAGDMTRTGTLKELESFVDWLDAQPHPHKVVIAGNHEVTLDSIFYHSNVEVQKRLHGRAWYRANATVPQHLVSIGCTVNAHCPFECARVIQSANNTRYLNSEGATVMGIRFWGSPQTPYFHDWAFALRNEREARMEWSDIHKDVDVLVTHGPPLGVLDQNDKGKACGCPNLMARIQQLPNLHTHIFGHIHNGAGALTRDGKLFLNASTCNEAYKPENAPHVLDIWPTSKVQEAL